MWPGPRPTSVPSFILIRPTVWPPTIDQRHRQAGQDRTGQDRRDSQRANRFTNGRPITTRYGEIFKILFRKDSLPHTSLIHVLCGNFVKFGRREVGEIACRLSDEKTKFRLAFSLSLLRGSGPKSARTIGRQRTQSAPKFHPNRFTCGEVIAERVNSVETRDKVNAILGEAVASRPVIIYMY